jgi:hypothetical protein
MFRHNISSIILIALIVISILCPSIQTKKVIYSSHDDTSAIGAYSDGTILFRIGSKDRLGFIRPDGTLGFIDNTSIHCKSKNSCNYNLLNPNYVIITCRETLVGTVIDWMGNSILKEFKTINNKLSINEKNDRFLIMEHDMNEFTEYHVENNGTITNRTSSLRFSKKNKEHIITEIISLDDAWGFISTAKEEKWVSIIHAESKHKTLKVKRLEDYKDSSSKCITIINGIQYCCLYKTHSKHTLKLVNLTLNDNTFNLKSTDLFPDIFDTEPHIHTIPKVGFLVEAASNSKMKYYIFNFFEIDYSDPNNAFGEWIMNNKHHKDHIKENNIFILPNEKIVQIRKNGDSIKFVQEDLSTRIPKSTY